MRPYLFRSRHLLAFVLAVVASHVCAQSTPWRELGPTILPVRTVSTSSQGLGRIHTIAVRPGYTGSGANNTILAGSYSAGLWKTTNSTASGSHWNPVNDQWDHRGIHSVAYAPSNANANIVYAGTVCSGIRKSMDGGATWNPLNDQ
jgi:hypothetical protein